MKTYGAKQAKADLPTRKNSDSKTRGGKCLIIAGSPGMWGAARLSSESAARAGAGYVYVFHAAQAPELKPDFLAQKQLSRAELEKFKAVAIGPGLPVTAATLHKIQSLKKFRAEHVVVDASALHMLSKKPFKLPATWILTPHEGELGRLLGLSGDAVRAAREALVKAAQKKFGCVVVLKGHGTLVADSQGVTKIDAGNSSLAKAGTGDVLTGLITAFLSQGLSARAAACLGVYVHGHVADLWIQSGLDQLSLMASDIIDQLPIALTSVRGKKRVRLSHAKKR